MISRKLMKTLFILASHFFTQQANSTFLPMGSSKHQLPALQSPNTGSVWSYMLGLSPLPVAPLLLPGLFAGPSQLADPTGTSSLIFH